MSNEIVVVIMMLSTMAVMIAFIKDLDSCKSDIHKD